MGQTTFTGPVVSQNGFLDSSFTTAERDAIVNPQPGLLIYNTSVNQYQVCTVGGVTPTWNYAFGDGVPNITNVSPSTGEAGDTVTITGTGLSDVTSVTFGATAATSFTVVSSTQITAVAPAGTGAVNVTVTDVAGSSTEVDGFTYAEPATVWSTSAFAGSDYEYDSCEIYTGTAPAAQLNFIISGAAETAMLALSAGTVFTVVNGEGVTPGDTITVTSITSPISGAVIVNGTYSGAGFEDGSTITRFSVV